MPKHSVAVGILAAILMTVHSVPAQGVAENPKRIPKGANADTSSMRSPTEPFLNAADYPGADIGAKINAAYSSADCPLSGCDIVIPSGRFVFSTGIVLGAKGKRIILRGTGPGTQLLYTGSQTALTVDWGTEVDAGIGAIENLTLLGPGSGTGAIGIAPGSRNKNYNAYFKGIKISGFKTGFEIGMGQDSWATTFEDGAVSGCERGFLFVGGVENVRIQNSNIFQNTVGLSVTTSRGAAQIHLVNNSFDDNTEVAIAADGNAEITGFGNHFENAGRGTSQYITLNNANARLSLWGGRMIDDASSGLRNQLVTATHANSLILDGVQVYSAGRVITQLVNAETITNGMALSPVNISPTYILADYNVGFTGRVFDLPLGGSVRQFPVRAQFFDLYVDRLVSNADNPAAAGKVSLGNNDRICWRNNANTGDICLSVASDNTIQSNGKLNAVLSQLLVTGATPAAAAGQVGIGNTTGFGNGFAGTVVTTTSRGSGAGPANPQKIVNYLELNLGGTQYWIPLVQ